MSCPAGRREHLFIRSLMVLPQAAVGCVVSRTGERVLFVGDDWAEDHHDVEVMGAAGGGLARQARGWRARGRDSSPAALAAFEDLDAAEALEWLAKAPDPASAAKLTTAQIDAALKRARRRNRADKTAAIKAALRSQ